MEQFPHSQKWTPLRTADRTTYLEEVRRGVPLGGEYYLRRFPVWFDFRGNSRAPVRFVNRETGKITDATVNQAKRTFRAVIPQGKYTVESGPVRTSLTALSAGSYQLDLRQDKAVDFSVSSRDLTSNEVLLQIAAQRMGTHTFTARVDNLELLGPNTKSASLGEHSKSAITWRARVIDPASPWVAVLLPDGQLTQHHELSGIPANK